MSLMIRRIEAIVDQIKEDERLSNEDKLRKVKSISRFISDLQKEDSGFAYVDSPEEFAKEILTETEDYAGWLTMRSSVLCDSVIGLFNDLAEHCDCRYEDDTVPPYAKDHKETCPMHYHDLSFVSDLIIETRNMADVLRCVAAIKKEEIYKELH